MARKLSAPVEEDTIAPVKLKRLPTLGDMERARIAVVCDAPSQKSWDKCLPISDGALNLFASTATECDFKKDDFFFIAPCPPIPEEIEKNERRIAAHALPYQEQVKSIIEDMQPDLIIFMGKWGGRVLTGKSVKITKARGTFISVNVAGTDYPVLPMLSPGHVYHRPELKDIFVTDFMMAMRLRDRKYNLAAVQADISDTKDYRWCTDLSELLANPPKMISVDTETTGLKWWTAGTDDPDAVKILTVQIGLGKGRALVVPMDCDYYPELTPKKRAKLLGQLRKLLENPKIRKAGHNFKYDTHVLREDLNIYIDYDCDTQLLAFIVDENMQEKSLDECVRRWVPRLAGYNDELNKKLDKENMRSTSHEDMLEYGGGDVDATFDLALILTKLGKKDARQWNCYQRIILPAIKAFCDPVELYGVRVNTKVLTDLERELAIAEREQYDILIDQVPAAIKRKHADKGLKFSRAAFLVDILFTKQGLNLKPRVFTASTAKLPEDQRIPSVSAKQHLPFFIENPFVAQLSEYVKLEKLRSTYVGVPYDEKKKGPTGFWQYIHNNEIHPSFILHRTVTGRAACLTGDTLISVLDERGLVPMRDIKEGDWVWSFNDQLKPQAAKVSWSGKTKKKTKIVRVSYLTQGTREVKSIRCTPDHLFRLRDGSYVRADQLSAGHRLLSIERQENERGYRRVHFTGCEGRSWPEHRLVYQSMHSELTEHVHHVDECKLNNCPDNLEGLTNEEHGTRHRWTPKRTAQMKAYRAKLKKENRLPAIKRRTGKNHPMYYELDVEWAKKVLWDNGGKPSVFRDVYDLDYTAIMTKLKAAGVDWRAIRSSFNSRGERIDDALLAKAKKANTLHEAAKTLGVNFYRAKELLADDHNHAVVGVEYLNQREDVYDITVPGTHNFIANGVCVHNSVNPNGQNFPKRGKLAKTYRKIFVARKGYKLLECDLSQAEIRIAAWMANEKNMIRIYKAGGDIHAATAAHTMGLTLEQFNALDKDTKKAKRQQAKAVVFGYIYGMWWKKFKIYAKTDYNLDFTDEQAAKLREDFFSAYPGLVEWHEAMRDQVNKYGYVRALHGAKRNLPSVYSPEDYIKQEAQRQAINSPVQRFASDLGLMAMVRLTRDADPEVIRPLLFIHDALVVEVKEEFAEQAQGWIKYYFESAPLEKWFDIVPPLPIVADVSTGYNLGEMEECEGVKAVKPPFAGVD